MLSTRFLGGVCGEMANMFDFCSSKGGTCGGNVMEMAACVVWGVGRGLLVITLERGDSKLFKMLDYHRGFGWGVW